jgi:hypothetical protein
MHEVLAKVTVKMDFQDNAFVVIDLKGFAVL